MAKVHIVKNLLLVEQDFKKITMAQAKSDMLVAAYKKDKEIATEVAEYLYLPCLGDEHCYICCMNKL